MKGYMLFIFVILAACLFAQNESEKMDSLLSQWDSIQSPGVMVTVMKGGIPIYEKGFGSAHLDYDIPITDSTVFHIASVSKQFTAFAIAVLAEQGKLSLDDDIHKYIPELPDYNEAITISHLVSHTNGLRDALSLLFMSGWQYEDLMTFNQALKVILRQEGLVDKPGTTFQYNNSGYTLLAHIIEKITGQSYSEWMKTNVFDPLEMNNSFIYDDHNVVVKNLAASYYQDEDDSHKPYKGNFTVYGPAGVYSTSKDLAKWANNFKNPKVGNPRLFDLMEERGVLSSGDTTVYAFGQAVVPYRGVKRVFHTGKLQGFVSGLFRYPDHDLSIIIFTNSRATNEQKLSEQITDIYLAEYLNDTVAEEFHHPKREEPEEISLSREELMEYVGTYHSSELRTEYAFVMKDDKLILDHPRYDYIVCKPIGEDGFDVYSQLAYTVRFQRNEFNEVTGMLVNGGRIREMEFTKTKGSAGDYR